VHPASVPDRSTMRSRKTSTRSKSTTWLFSLLILIASALCQAPLSNTHADFSRRLVAAAIDRTHHAVRYDPAYVRIPYPGGDVPADTGVCTDEIIRSYRAVGVDLQKEVLRTWQRISPTSPEARVGSPGSWTQISITVECRTLWFFFSERASNCLSQAGRGLHTGGPRHLGYWRRRAAHRHGGRSEGRQRKLHDCSQYRPGTTNGGRPSQLENYRPLSLPRAERLDASQGLEVDP
jgi:hypothetical protein